MEGPAGAVSGQQTLVPVPRVADFTVSNSRYEEEFLEVETIAAGQFGSVKRARHRLDGVDYAVKISR